MKKLLHLSANEIFVSLSTIQSTLEKFEFPHNISLFSI